DREAARQRRVGIRHIEGLLGELHPMRQTREILPRRMLQPAPQYLFPTKASLDEMLRRALHQPRLCVAQPMVTGVEQRAAGGGQTLPQIIQALCPARQEHLRRTLEQSCDSIVQSMSTRVQHRSGGACKTLLEVVDPLC